MGYSAIGAIVTLILSLLAVPLAAAAPPVGKVWRIGYLDAGSGRIPEAFRQGLRDLGYVEGQNLVVEYRYAEGSQERLPALAAELVQLQVEVIVAGGSTTIRAAQHASYSSDKTFGRKFAMLAPSDKRDFVNLIRQNKAEGWQGPAGPFVYGVLRSDAVDVVYSTMEGYEALGVPYMAHIIGDRLLTSATPTSDLICSAWALAGEPGSPGMTAVSAATGSIMP